MNNSTDDFIKQAGKSNQKAVVDYNAFTGEQGKSKNELDVTREDVYFIIKFLIIFSVVSWVCLEWTVVLGWLS